MIWRHLPNAITLVRIALVPPAMWAVVAGRYAMALSLILLAGASDALDGYLARHFGWTSRLGAILDPLADKLLMVASFVTLGLLGHIPLWLTGLVVARDVTIVSGALAYHYTVGPVELRPTSLSRVNTVLQIALVVETLIRLNFVGLPGAPHAVLEGAVALATAASGLHYVWTWSARARAQRPHS